MGKLAMVARHAIYTKVNGEPINPGAPFEAADQKQFDRFKKTGAAVPAVDDEPADDPEAKAAEEAKAKAAEEAAAKAKEAEEAKAAKAKAANAKK